MKMDQKIQFSNLNSHSFVFSIRLPESLRKFPPSPIVLRKVTKDYQVPESKVVFKKGMIAMVSVYGIHHDPEFYPNPEVFDPERFSPENVAKRHSMAFIPFSEMRKRFINYGLIDF